MLESVDVSAHDAPLGSWLAARLDAKEQPRHQRRALAVDGKTNEITEFAPLLQPLKLTWAVITADALDIQRDHAEFLVRGKNVHYTLVVKNHQPSLYAQLTSLPWRDIPAGHPQRERVFGRQKHRTLKVAAVAARLGCPHTAHAIRITRRNQPLSGNKWQTVTIYAITSLTASQAIPAQFVSWIRGHWQTEAMHHIRSPGVRDLGRMETVSAVPASGTR